MSNSSVESDCVLPDTHTFAAATAAAEGGMRKWMEGGGKSNKIRLETTFKVLERVAAVSVLKEEGGLEEGEFAGLCRL